MMEAMMTKNSDAGPGMASTEGADELLELRVLLGGCAHRGARALLRRLFGRHRVFSFVAGEFVVSPEPNAPSIRDAPKLRVSPESRRPRRGAPR